MMINAELVRAQRTRRGWTQQQMAEVADLSLRTVQRIENQGVASNESISALSSVLEIPREELLVRSEQTAIQAGVERRLLLLTGVAAAAGASIGAVLTLLLTGALGGG